MYRYKRPLYWTDALFISFLQRTILIHSYLYYEKDTNIWSDKQFDAVAKQLVREQQYHTEAWIRNKTDYGYCFYDFDGTTGFDLWCRLEEEDQKMISSIANMIIGRR